MLVKHGPRFVGMIKLSTTSTPSGSYASPIARLSAPIASGTCIGLHIVADNLQLRTTRLDTLAFFVVYNVYATSLLGRSGVCTSFLIHPVVGSVSHIYLIDLHRVHPCTLCIYRFEDTTIAYDPDPLPAQQPTGRLRMCVHGPSL